MIESNSFPDKEILMICAQILKKRLSKNISRKFLAAQEISSRVN